MYHAVSPAPLDDVPDDANVVLSGPPMSGKYELCLRYLVARSERAIVFTTGRHAEQVRSDYGRWSDSADDLTVIDCTSRAHESDITDTSLTRYVGSPGNLTDMGVQFTAVAADVAADRVGVGVCNVSDLLMFHDTPKVYRFLRTLVNHVDDHWFVVAVVNDAMHDEQTLSSLYEPFDALVETRLSDSGREARIRGRATPSPEWVRF